MCECKCKGAVSSKGDKGDNGINGTDGTNGNDGLYGGWSNKWVFNDGNANNPASTTMRLNTANPAAATAIYINVANSSSIDLTAFLASFLNSSNYGYLRIFKEYDSKLFSYYKITNYSLAAGVVTLSVTYKDGSDAGLVPYITGIPMVITFTPASNAAAYLTDSEGLPSVANISLNAASTFTLFTGGCTIISEAIYKLTFEADMISNTAPIEIAGKYFFIKNGVNTAIGIRTTNEKRDFALNVPDAGGFYTTKLMMQTTASLLPGDVVNVNLTVTTYTGTSIPVSARSLIVKKIS